MISACKEQLEYERVRITERSDRAISYRTPRGRGKGWPLWWLSSSTNDGRFEVHARAGNTFTVKYHLSLWYNAVFATVILLVLLFAPNGLLLTPVLWTASVVVPYLYVWRRAPKWVQKRIDEATQPAPHR